MPLRLTIAARDLASGWKKGDLVAALPEGGTWGNREVPPDFIRVLVTNGTQADIDSWIKQWKKAYTYSLDAEDALSYTITLRVDPAVIDASQSNATLAEDLADFLVNHETYTITILVQTSTQITARIEKPADLNALAIQIREKFQAVVAMSLLYVPSATVDSIIANDPVTGYFERNRGQMNSFLANKLNS